MNKKIKELRLSRGYTQQQLADLLGIKSYTTITKWESGDNVPQGKDLIKLSKLFKVSVDDLLGIKIKGKTNTRESDYFPTAISAGLPLEVDGMTESSKISISDEILGRYKNDRSIFFVRANGDSMNRLFDDGSLLAIQPISDMYKLKNGDIVVYSINGEYSVKHFYKYGDTLVFKPNSTTQHKEHEYNAKEDNVQIHGKVVTYIVNLD